MTKVHPVFSGKVFKDGKLYMLDRVSFDRYVKSLAPIDKEFMEVGLTVKKKRSNKDRSNPQNKYYWGVVIVILMDYFGYTKDEMHVALGWKFLMKEGKIPTIRSTTDLSTIEWEEHMKNIREWASADWGVYIPLPNETEFDYDIKCLT